MNFGFRSSTESEASNQSYSEIACTTKFDSEKAEQQGKDRYFDETNEKSSLNKALDTVDEQVFVDDKTYVDLDMLDDELMSVEFS